MTQQLQRSVEKSSILENMHVICFKPGQHLDSHTCRADKGFETEPAYKVYLLLFVLADNTQRRVRPEVCVIV